SVEVPGVRAFEVEAQLRLPQGFGDEVHYAVLSLDLAVYAEQHRGLGQKGVGLEHPAPHDDVDEPRLVLEGEERDTAGRPRPLAADHEPDVVEYAAGAPLGDLFGARDVAAPQLAPERFEGVPAGAVHARAVVPEHGLAGREHGKARLLRGGGD